ncbi:proprotein convertase P-domain-containing protein [Lentzea aerocolonigenes]|uniref:proprotein convertase P-domain-containing protein n=1 Tax=Lentzea aerocolonigenes TaxID=68170 RepID=UPI000689E8B3|nr:proprotein convertase P-domain-containing protein [Lentzea aerocolonigenes]MCP2244199.1 streptogrisin C [Lentzea aerocolonigenes]
MRLRGKIVAAACGSVLVIATAHSASAVQSTFVAQNEAHQRFTTLSPELRAQLAGHWFDAAAGKLTVAVPDEKTAEQARARGINAVLVRRSAADLERLLGQVRKLIGNGVPGVYSWGVDVRDNQVDVTVNTSSRNHDTERFLERVRELDGVNVVETKSQQRQQSGTVQTGSPWWPGSETYCSVGFAATDANGGKHFLTAGHCTNDANQAAHGQTGQQNRIGTSNVGGTRSVNAPEGDMGVVAVTEAGWTLSPVVNTWGQPAVTVTGSAEAMVGDRVCHSGNTSKWQCGEVKYTHKSVDYGGGLIIEDLTFTTACSKGGDSGGGWLLGDKAVGLHDGGPSQCVQNPSDDELSIFQPVNEALQKWNLTLVTGAGTGDTTAPTVPGNARSTGVTSSSASLAWDASTDDVGVTGYEVLNGGTVATKVTGTTATVSGLTADTAYSFTVRAVDAAGNQSKETPAIAMRTSGDTGGRTFTNDADHPIRDFQVTISAVRSTATGSAASPITVGVDATHTCQEDLNVTLVAPSGRAYPLLRTPGGLYDCHPFPAGRTFSVSPVAGEAAGGTWTLRIGDNGPGDVGVLSGWSVTV